MPRFNRRPRGAFRRRQIYIVRKQLRFTIILAFLLMVIVAGMSIGGVLRELSGQMALSDAKDTAIDTVNEAMLLMMSRGNYDYDYFVDLGVSSDGQVTSLNANMSRINAFSAALLDYVGQLDRKNIRVSIPLGNLTGSSLLLGRGPEIEIQMIMLTSPHIAFRSELSAAGINQTEHRLLLDVVVDIDVLVPWGSVETQATTEVLIAQTVIVGRVPNLYMNTTE
ncbi:MAG: sporulation protein YunB [Oscillospiraceae bacterium]|nr:sporulation protein YunB [Oscillospiraceae bacterium]